MFYVYILQSLKDFDLYVGSTSDLKRRVEEHNKGEVRSTKHRLPLKLVYYEAYRVEESAREREKSLKQRGQTGSHLMKRIGKSLLRKHS